MQNIDENRCHVVKFEKHDILSSNSNIEFWFIMSSLLTKRTVMKEKKCYCIISSLCNINRGNIQKRNRASRDMRLTIRLRLKQIWNWLLSTSVGSFQGFISNRHLFLFTCCFSCLTFQHLSHPFCFNSLIFILRWYIKSRMVLTTRKRRNGHPRSTFYYMECTLAIFSINQ